MQKLGFQKLPAENQEIEERDENRPADGVAYRHKEKILRKRRCGERGESSAVQHHAQRDEKHICDAVLEPHRDESGDRKQSRNELAGRILRAESYPHGEADEPVAEHAADEHLSGGKRRLHRRERKRGGTALFRDKSAREYERREKQSAREICKIDGADVAHHRSEGDLFRKTGDRHKTVARYKFRAGGKHEEKTEREDDPAEHLRNADAGELRRVLRDDEHEIPAHPDISSGKKAHQNHSPKRKPALRNPRRKRSLRNLRRRLNPHKNLPFRYLFIVIFVSLHYLDIG